MGGLLTCRAFGWTLKESCAKRPRYRVTSALARRPSSVRLTITTGPEDPTAREDLMDLYRRWRSNRDREELLMPHDVQIETYGGPRSSLRALFELAEDSATELDSYIGVGRVLVAVSDGEIIGHLQLTGTDDARQAEIKNMAVLETRQGQGVGRLL